MSHLPDTSFLYSLYRQQVHSPRVIAYMQTLSSPLPVSTLLVLEFRQSVRLQTRLHAHHKTKGFSKADGAATLRDLQSDWAAKIWEIVPVDWADVHGFAERLSATYTERRGHRLLDILHAATALYLGASKFLTFDASQKRFAETVDLAVNV